VGGEVVRPCIENPEEGIPVAKEKNHRKGQ